MYIFLEKANILINIINSIKDLVDQGTFSCKSDCLEFKSLDKSHVAYIHLCLYSKNFDEYKFTTDSIVNDKELDLEKKSNIELLGVDINSISTILKWVKNNECLIWKSTEDDKMTFIIGNEQKKNFTLRLLNLEYEELDIPDTKYDCKLKLNSSKFADICKDLSLLSENVTIQANSECNDIVFKIESLSTSGEITLSDDEDKSISIKVKNEFNNKFSLQYFNHFSKAVVIASKVTIYFTQDTPAIIEYKIPHMGFLTYYLAPKED